MVVLELHVATARGKLVVLGLLKTLRCCFNEGLLDVHDVEEMLGLVQLRSESKDDNDGDTMVMVGDVCSAERGGQGWYGGSFGLKPKRKRKAMKGLFWLFLVTGKKRRKEAGGDGATVASLGFDRNPFFFGKCLFYFYFFL
ncbi:hypothetical protein NC653_031318 [Populus alba x Populus x berolinensis]|uniref:Uncharacterized protein n=1 Tax=Populus alba x Populus x berolinensis TaxID=444605 RepID=A0AAD6LY55_9ROSI|nr:hypothetical protein NC653_031318 [Populus alba x Populus x berolinensis]